MAQFDVYENPSKRSAKQFPLLLEVQSDVFEDSTRAVYVPLVNAESLKNPDKTLNVKFLVAGSPVRLFPLDIASAPRSSVGSKVANLATESDKVIAALDLLFARY